MKKDHSIIRPYDHSNISNHPLSRNYFSLNLKTLVRINNLVFFRQKVVHKPSHNDYYHSHSPVSLHMLYTHPGH